MDGMRDQLATLDHPLRVPLAAEIHSRPFLQLETPESLSHLAVYTDHAAQHRLLSELCTAFGVACPGAEASYFFHDFGRFRLKWERHTEFATYSFAQKGGDFDAMPIAHVPAHWLRQLEGLLMVAAHVLLEDGGSSAEEQHPRFQGNLMVGGSVMQGAQLWTDFAIQPDGFSRFVIRDVDMRMHQAGRLVQRVLEIETYRMMALLGLPHAQRAAADLNGIESELAELTNAMVDAEAGPAEHALLDRITRLAARMEKLSLDNSYRFAASRAYFKLVKARIDELREVRIEGTPTVGEFMDRRLAPAMNTCEAMATRQEALARRIANSNDLLRTRVGIVQEQQNRLILQSLNERAAQQLRLQQAVEGLSVAAITYYVVGLFGYGGKAAKAAGWLPEADIAIGILVPVVAAAVWLGLRRMHQRLGGVTNT
jgi:uncharacterized membrane-anchored protein